MGWKDMEQFASEMPLPPVEAYGERGNQTVKAKAEPRFRTTVEANQYLKTTWHGQYWIEMVMQNLYVIRRNGLCVGKGMTIETAFADTESNGFIL